MNIPSLEEHRLSVILREYKIVSLEIPIAVNYQDNVREKMSILHKNVVFPSPD